MRRPETSSTGCFACIGNCMHRKTGGAQKRNHRHRAENSFRVIRTKATRGINPALRFSTLRETYPSCAESNRSDSLSPWIMDTTITFTVNGKPRTVTTDPQRPLLDVLREDLQLTGT